MVTMTMTEVSYPITVTLTSGTVLHVVADRESIEAYGNVNKLVNTMIKPLEAVARIEVEMYCDFMEDQVTEVTYDTELEAWKKSGERVVITYDFHGIEEEERGYIDFKDGWLPTYTLRKLPQAKQMHSLITDEIKEIKSARLANKEAKAQRSLDRYYKDPAKANAQRMAKYYEDHEDSKKRNAEAGRRWRKNQKRYGLQA